MSTDEGDHFSGSAPAPANCTGAPGNYCSYSVKSEVNVNLPGLLATQAGDTTPFAIHSEPAPALWVTGNPSRTDPSVRTLERDIAGLRFTNPLTGATGTGSRDGSAPRCWAPPSATGRSRATRPRR